MVNIEERGSGRTYKTLLKLTIAALEQPGEYFHVSHSFDHARECCRKVWYFMNPLGSDFFNKVDSDVLESRIKLYNGSTLHFVKADKFEDPPYWMRGMNKDAFVYPDHWVVEKGLIKPDWRGIIVL